MRMILLDYDSMKYANIYVRIHIAVAGGPRCHCATGYDALSAGGSGRGPCTFSANAHMPSAPLDMLLPVADSRTRYDSWRGYQPRVLSAKVVDCVLNQHRTCQSLQYCGAFFVLNCNRSKRLSSTFRMALRARC